MKAMDTVRKAAGDKGIALGNIGLELGKSRQYVNAIMTKGNTPRADTLAKMLAVCGYKLAAIPENRIPADALVIDGGGETDGD